jgi:hypothetical protein
MLTLVSLEVVGTATLEVGPLVVVGAVTFESTLLTAVGDTALSVVLGDVDDVVAQAAKALMLSTMRMLKMVLRFIDFLHL